MSEERTMELVWKRKAILYTYSSVQPIRQPLKELYIQMRNNDTQLQKKKNNK